MDENLERGERKSRRRVDDSTASRVPPTGSEKPASAAQRTTGVPRSADPPKAHEIFLTAGKVRILCLGSGLTIDSVAQSQQEIFDLLLSDLGIEVRKRRFSSERPIGPGEPMPGFVDRAEDFGCEKQDVGHAV